MIAPYISRDDVSNALASLFHPSRKLESTGLRHLLLIDLQLLSPDMPDGDTVREFAVRDLLVSTITQELTRQRAIFRLMPPDESADVVNVRAEAADAVEKGANELLIWSLLYYRCVRTDLNLSVEALAMLLALHPRTIPRYFSDGADLLTDQLIRLEQQARRQQAERRLYAALPYSVPVRMFGRSNLLETVQSSLGKLSPRHILITGAVGVGKTLFVQEFIRRQIDKHELDCVLWFDQPESVTFVRQRIHESLLREGGDIRLRDYLLIYQAALVLDGLDSLATDLDGLEAFLPELGGAQVFLINRTHVTVAGVSAQIEIPELDHQAADAIIDDLFPDHDELHRRDLAATLYERLGGNPLALRIAARMWDNGNDWTSITSELYERLFGMLLRQLNDAARRAWCALALCPHNVRVEVPTNAWGISRHELSLLRRYGVIEFSDDVTISLSAAAREYILLHHTENPVILRLVDELIEQLADTEADFEIIEYILASGFPKISAEMQLRWIYRFWKEGLRRNHWAQWRAHLEKYLTYDESFMPELHTAYAVCLRRLSEWESAENVFRRVVSECGRQGRFAEQGRALVEWSVLAKFQGNFQLAREMTFQAKRYAHRARDIELLNDLAQHEAELLIQQGEAEEAIHLLARQPDSLPVLILHSEAQLMLGKFSDCRLLAARALKFVADDQATEASLYTIIGRSFQEQSALQQSQQSLTDAVMLLERLDDAFSLARAQTNLAAVLIPLGRLTDAGTLLARAEHIQASLGDRVGLSATRHNRTLLGSHFAG